MKILRNLIYLILFAAVIVFAHNEYSREQEAEKKIIKKFDECKQRGEDLHECTQTAGK